MLVSMQHRILVINSGSSSVKFSVFDGRGLEDFFCVKEGEIDVLSDKKEILTAIESIAALLQHEYPNDAWTAIGHRVVHGGQKFIEPLLIDEINLAELSKLIPLDPLHQQNCIEAIAFCQRAFKGVPQIACFDTAFHATQPQVATAIALPKALTDKGIRRYGFHGLSYQYIVSVIQNVDPNLADGRLIIAHLGSGASLCAVRAGKSVATTMGFSVLDGLMMGTRCGSIDPGVLLYLLNQLHVTANDLEEILYNKSGLLGVSGISSDIRTLLSNIGSEASEAIELYVYRIVREIGSLVASLQGLDGIIFTGGVGEHSAPIRQAVLEQLTWLGFEIDNTLNENHSEKISSINSKLPAYVIHTDENRMIAVQISQMKTT